MKRYEVSWTIDIYANTPKEAATEAAEIQRNPISKALHFVVQNKKDVHEINTVDLLDENIQRPADKITEFLRSIHNDIEMLRNGEWVPDEHSCDATIELIERIANELNIELE